MVNTFERMYKDGIRMNILINVIVLERNVKYGTRSARSLRRGSSQGTRSVHSLRGAGLSGEVESDRAGDGSVKRIDLPILRQAHDFIAILAN